MTRHLLAGESADVRSSGFGIFDMSTADDTVHVARSILAALGREWQKADAVERLDTALGWLAREGASLPAVAEHLRGTADLLDEDPTELLHQRLAQQERDLRALIEARSAA